MEEQKENKPVDANQPKSSADKEDVEKNKAIAVLAYFVFFLPLLAAKESKFAMYHANQALLLFIGAVILNVLGSAIPVLGWFLILPIGWIAITVFAIMGIIHAAQGEMKPLPLFGHLTIIHFNGGK